MRTITVTGNETIQIGRRGENQATQIIWTNILENWRTMYGDGVVQLAVRRPNDTDPYPAACEVIGNDIIWTIQAADTAQNGAGECELSYIVDAVLVKSQTWDTMIARSLTGDGTVDPPSEPSKTWFSKIQSEIGNLEDLGTGDKSNLVAAINEVAQSVGGSTSDHTKLKNRDADNQHPMSAITGLTDALAGKQPTGNYLTRDDLQDATDKALAQAKASGEFDGATGPAGAPGKDGTSGADGVTPHIGDNGNWYLGTTDTNKPSRGAKGDKGDPGKDAPPPTDEQVQTATDAWLNAHPDATTTVQDGSINPDKTTWMRKVYHNIFDVSTITDGRYFFSDSNDNTTGGGTADYFVSDYIPVIAGREYVFSHKNMVLRWTDANKTFISGSASTVSVKGQKVTSPDGAAFVRFSLKKSGLTPEEVQAQVYEYIGEVWEYDTYKNLYSIVVTDAGYSKAIADMIEGKFVDGSLAPADLFADESILYKQMKGWDEFHWNLVDADKLEEGTINATTGADKFAPNSFIYRRTPYMPVTPGETLFWMWSEVYGYDANKNFVSEITNTSGIGVVPDGVYFIRATTYGNVEPTINIYRRGYGQNELIFDSKYPYSHGFPVFKDEDSKEGFECYLGIHPWADKNFGIIGDSFTAPGVWGSVMCANLKAANRWNHAVSGANFADADGVPKTAYEQAQEMVTDGNTPDVILITMGTNDANNSRTIGDIVQSNSISDFDLTTYTGGMQACLNYLQNNFTNAIIYVGWTPMGGLVNGTKAEYITRMQEVCLMYGVEYIETRTCGVTRFSDVYAECYENGTNGGHPTGVGQQKIGAYMTRLMQSKM